MSGTTGLFDELRMRRRDLFRIVGPGIVAALCVFLVAMYFVEPAPPKSLLIATGKAGGRYQAFAQAYARSLSKNGIELEVKETAGSVENFELLRKGDASLAIVQGGTAPAKALDSGQLESIATLYFEPLWVFHQGTQTVDRLSDVRGMRIAVGEPGSGTYALATQLLAENGIAHGIDNTVFVTRNSIAAAESLAAAEIDVAMFVTGAESELITQLIRNPDVHLMDFTRQKGYERKFPFLKGVTLEEGVIDMKRNLPAHRVRLLAPAANLVASQSMHRAFVPLLLQAAMEQHHDGGMLSGDGELPSLEFVSFPINSEARQYLDHGPSFFQQHLSFWVASLIDRTKIMIIPLLTLFLPLVKLAPPVYRWRIRSRIYRWYGVLRRIDQQLREGEETDLVQHAGTLRAMSAELDSVDVPLSYMQEFYNLRLHVDLVSAELDVRMSEKNTHQTTPAPKSTDEA